MEVVVKLRVKEESVPEGKDIHSYIREELGWLEESGIFPEAIMPAKTEEEMFETFLIGRNELLNSSVARVLNMFQYTGSEDDKSECNNEHVGNVADMICEYIEQEMESEVCWPFKSTTALLVIRQRTAIIRTVRSSFANKLLSAKKALFRYIRDRAFRHF